MYLKKEIENVWFGSSLRINLILVDILQITDRNIWDTLVILAFANLLERYTRVL